MLPLILYVTEVEPIKWISSQIRPKIPVFVSMSPLIPHLKTSPKHLEMFWICHRVCPPLYSSDF